MAFLFPTSMSFADFKASIPKPAAATTPRTVASVNEESDEDGMPWDDEDWIPKTSTGKQKTPNKIRNEFQRFLDGGGGGRTQTEVLKELRINNNSFRKFMNPKTYKDPWSAAQNSTYWKAARFLAQHNHDMKLQKKQEQKENKKMRKDGSGAVAEQPAKKAKTSRAEADAWMQDVLATTGANTDVVYDSCPQIVKKIKDCLKDTPGITKASFCKIALDGCNANSLTRFLAAKQQDQQGNSVYPKAYAFFEKLRIKNGQAKSNARIKNEAEKGHKGFGTHTIRTNSYYIVAR